VLNLATQTSASVDRTFSYILVDNQTSKFGSPLDLGPACMMARVWIKEDVRPFVSATFSLSTQTHHCDNRKTHAIYMQTSSVALIQLLQSKKWQILGEFCIVQK